MKSTTERNPVTERLAFSDRLKKALSEYDSTLLSATVFAREFNRRSKQSSISTTTAHKWLSAESIPKQEKLSFIAHWVKVPVQWLRYGDEEAPALTGSEKRRHDRLLSDFSSLNERDKKIIEAMARELMRIK